MYIARREGTEPWLIPDIYRQKYEAMGFRRFDEPPLGTAEVKEPVPFDEISAQAEARPLVERDPLSQPSVAVVSPSTATLGGDKSRAKRKRGS